MTCADQLLGPKPFGKSVNLYGFNLKVNEAVLLNIRFRA